MGLTMPKSWGRGEGWAIGVGLFDGWLGLRGTGGGWKLVIEKGSLRLSCVVFAVDGGLSFVPRQPGREPFPFGGAVLDFGCKAVDR
jgi:hypothetical protein